MLKIGPDAANYEITEFIGDDLRLDFELLNDDNTSIDLTGYTVTLAFYNSATGAELLSRSSADSEVTLGDTDYQVKCTISAADMAELVSTKFNFAYIFEDPSGFIDTWINGVIRLIKR